MDTKNLVNMANRIGDFFASKPDRTEAKQDIATHLKKFWEPRMRHQLLQEIDQPSTDDLQPIVREALTENIEQLQ